MVSCPKIFRRIIKECDLFGTLITFQINNDYDYKSVIGGASTLIFLSIAITYILYMGLRFILRKEVNFIYSNKILDHGPFVDLDKDNFKFAFGVQYADDASSACNDTKKYFDYKLYSILWLGEGDKDYTTIGYKVCEESDFPPDVSGQFLENELYEMYCPILNESLNFTLDGLYTDYFYKYLRLDIKLSDYALTHLDEVRKVLEENPIEAAIYFVDTAIDYSSRKNYLPSYINYLYKIVDLDFEKTTQILISSIQFSNDENIIISNPKTVNDSMYDNSLDTFKYIRDRIQLKEYYVYKFVIKASSRIIQLSRSYQKLPSFIADVSGILEEFLALLLLFVNIIERKAVDKKLIQKMLKFNGSKYYNIKYMGKIFTIDEFDNNIKNLINKEKLIIMRNGKGNIVSSRKSIMNLLDERKNIKFLRNRFSKSSIRELANKNNFNLYQINNNNNDNNLEEIQSVHSKESESVKTKSLIKEDLNNNNNIFDSERNKINNSEYNKNLSDLNSNDEKIIINTISSYNSNDKEFHIKNKNNFFPKINSYTYHNKRTYPENKEINLINNNIEFGDLRVIESNNDFNKKNFINNSNVNTSDHLTNKYENKTILKNNEDEEENFGKFTTFDYLIASFCYCCSKKQKKRNHLLKKCERKIHYYLDIYTYIKKMQEIDLIKYCLFDDDQLKLFRYLSTPPVKLSEKNIGIYQEFEKQQINYSKMEKKEIDEIYNSYKQMAKKKDITFEDIKLMRLVNAEIEYLN